MTLERSTAARGSRGWLVGTVVGLAAWIGATVLAASRVEPGDDGTVVLRTFAGAGAAVLGAIFAAAAVGVTREARRARVDLLERLALTPLTDRARRRATLGARPLSWWYLAMSALLSGLMLGAIALGTDRALRLLLPIALLVVVVWARVAMRMVTRLPASSAEVLEPLGLRVDQVPFVSTDAPRPMGPLVVVGRRHGRDVVVTQTSSECVTEVSGRSVAGSEVRWTAARLAEVTGLPGPTWSDVEVRSRPGRVTVARSGNGAGRWFLHDLLLAEAVAAGPADALAR